MSDQLVNLVVDGRPVAAPPSMSVIEAVWYAGYTQVEGVGCLQGVCGTCRIMVQHPDSREVTMQLACETLITEGMQVNYISFQERRGQRTYQIEDFQDTWEAFTQIQDVFPEAVDCRHCGGCDVACPKGILVQKGVNMAAGADTTGLDPIEAGKIFDHCVMCNLCTHACPENIRPNHLALLVRRMTASLLLRPTNLIVRLEQIRNGELTIEDEQLADDVAAE
jgi:succinate dehydrogenase/fumarate reductase-like Fe-S protein